MQRSDDNLQGPVLSFGSQEWGAVSDFTHRAISQVQTSLLLSDSCLLSIRPRSFSCSLLLSCPVYPSAHSAPPSLPHITLSWLSSLSFQDFAHIVYLCTHVYYRLRPAYEGMCMFFHPEFGLPHLGLSRSVHFPMFSVMCAHFHLLGCPDMASLGKQLALGIQCLFPGRVKIFSMSTRNRCGDLGI